MQQSRSNKGIDRVAIQRKVFTNWVNSKLSTNKLNNLMDLGDGIHLTNLFENLSGKTMGKAVVATPKSTLQKLGNLSAVLSAFGNDGVRVDISAQELMEYKETMVLGFIWVLIRKYGKVESNELLLLALRKLCAHYSIAEPDSINAKWFQDGLIFNAIVHANAPKSFSFQDVLAMDVRQRLNTAFQAGEQHVGVSRMLDVDDVLVGNVDADSIVTYISNFSLRLENLPSPLDGPTAVKVVDWEALYHAEHEKVLTLEKSLSEFSDKVQALEVRLQKSEDIRDKLEDEIIALQKSLNQAAGNAVDASAEIDRLKDVHMKKLEEMRAAEEEREKELAQIRQESRLLEEARLEAESKLEEASRRSLEDEKRLQELDSSKRYLESEIEALHRRLDDKDQEENQLVAQSSELKSVLSGLMEQLENVSREEQTVKTRKKGQDKERDSLAAQMEKLIKEKKEIEKKHDKAMKELEKLKKNRDSEIKKLKKRIDDVQRGTISKMDTSEKDKEIERLQKLLNEALQREADRKKSTEEALRMFAANLEEAQNAKSSLEKEMLKMSQGDFVDEALQKQLNEEMEKMKQEHEAALEGMRQQEEEKNQELEKLRNESKKLEDAKVELETKMQEMNQKYTSDVKLLEDLGQCKKQLDGEIDTLRRRLLHSDQSQNDLVIQQEEMKQVLSGLMEQLEAVAKEESVVDTRKKGHDVDRGAMSDKLEKVMKEKKEIEKQNEKALKDLEKIKKNRDNEIKKLKKNLADAQSKAGKGAALERVKELEGEIGGLKVELDRRREAEMKEEQLITVMKNQLAEMTASRDTLRLQLHASDNGSSANLMLEEKEKKWKEEEELLAKKANVYARDLMHYKERKEYYKDKYRQSQPELVERTRNLTEKEKKELRDREKKERKEQEKTLKRKEKDDRKRAKEELKRLEAERKR